MLTLSEKYFVSMAAYLKTINSDIFENVMPLGVVIALFYELLEKEKLCLKDKKVTICGDRLNETPSQKIIMDTIEKNEYLMSFIDWLKEFYFSIDSEYIREILAITEKSVIQTGSIKKSEKKVLFIKKIIYTAEKGVFESFSQEIEDEPQDGIFGYLLYRFGLLDFVCKKDIAREVKSKIKLELKDKNEFLLLTEEAILSISSALSTSSVMM